MATEKNQPETDERVPPSDPLHELGCRVLAAVLSYHVGDRNVDRRLKEIRRQGWIARSWCDVGWRLQCAMVEGLHVAVPPPPPESEKKS